MAKLVYRTKPPRKGYSCFASHSTHESTSNEVLPDETKQKQALKIVSEKMLELIKELEKLECYDSTKVRFQIHLK